MSIFLVEDGVVVDVREDVESTTDVTADELGDDDWRDGEAIVGMLVAADGTLSSPVPSDKAVQIRRVQLELWLSQNGFLEGLEDPAIKAAVSGLNNPEANIRLRSGQLFQSDDPLIVALAATLGVTDIRAAFVAASALD